MLKGAQMGETMLEFDKDNNVISQDCPRAVLVGVSLGEDISYSMEELTGLAEAAGIEVAAQMTQNVDRINAGTYVGTGKLEELAEFCKNSNIDLVVFNDELSGMQLRNIEDACDTKVIDRTILILDIFASRATSAEGKLQVELAQLSYRMPRLLGFGKSLSRLGGGIGTRGPGETKLETDRRHIQKRMDQIKSEIKELNSTRATKKAKRDKSEIPVVALVGYTNSGKSSIMNALLKAEDREEKTVFEKNMLFATLDTSQRLITLDDKKSFILVDTVGFVSKLPHTLVSAFKSTLEEAVDADLLVQVVDASYEGRDFYIDVTDSVLRELKADGKPMIMAFNKCDLLDEKGIEDLKLSAYGKDSLLMSAKTGDGLDGLIDMIKAKIFADTKVVSLLIPFTDGAVLSAVIAKNKPLETEYQADGTKIKVELSAADISRYAKYIISECSILG